MADRFSLGNVYITSNARDELHPDDVLACLARHGQGDWGDLCEEDRLENERSLKHGWRLLSSYRDRNDTKFWIITEADRSSTTILSPEEY